MTDALFILTIVFVAYVVYTMVDEQKATTKSTTPEVKPEVVEPEEKQKAEIASKPQPNIEADVEPVPAAITPPPPVETKVTRANKKTSVAAAEQTTTKHQVRNPKTGEITTTTGNYRFAKRWLKEILVTEKLLDKIYKNDELNEETEAKIRGALAKLEKMKKYKA